MIVLLHFSPYLLTSGLTFVFAVALLVKALQILGERGQNPRDRGALICLACVCLPAVCQIENCFSVGQIMEKNVRYFLLMSVYLKR